jgi:EAL domain-containing protein (putative c-di-GMP-specific phosphodiesterase class I)
MDGMMEMFNKPFSLKGQKFYITASAGVTLYPIDGEDPEKLIKNADIAMYRAKQKGKNQYHLCSAEMKEEVQKKMKLTGLLYHALEKDELLLYYQPQVSLRTKTIIGLEALLRWKHPKLGMIYPKSFISIAEQTGLINPIGKWVIETACRQNKMWQDMGLPRIRMAVNASVYQFRDAGFVEHVADVLEKTGLAPEDFELEITETEIIREADYIISILNKLKKLGIVISIDDFGTEYSSLSRLKMLPIDRIKMDMQFVHGIEKSDKDKAITKVIISLAQNLGVKIVAEGVETEQQLKFLSQKMCDEVQGFYCYEPMPAEEIEVVLRNEEQTKIMLG